MSKQKTTKRTTLILTIVLMVAITTASTSATPTTTKTTTPTTITPTTQPTATTIPPTDQKITTQTTATTIPTTDAKSLTAQSAAASSSPDPVSFQNLAPKYSFKPDGYLETGIQSGAASYTYDLTLPPGTDGLTPKVTLSYNSQAADGQPGLLGDGWSLNMNYIQRDTNYTFANTSDDKFTLYLDGQSNELVYTGGTRYHTKIETDLDVENMGGYWTVKTTDGTIYRFGISSASTLNSNLYSYVTRWYLEQAEDTHGNRIYYSYQINPNPNDAAAIYPNKITYNNDQTREIDFLQESTDRPDLRTIYTQGNKAQYSRRIKEIQVKASNQLVRKYLFTYATASSFPISLLTEIMIVGSDGITTLPKTTFQYKSVAPAFIRDDRLAIPGSSIGPGDVPWLNYAGGNNGVQLIDVNGDGLVDILQASWTNNLNYVRRAWLNNGTGWVRDDRWAIPVSSSNPSDGPWFNYVGGDYGVQLIDVNGDGLVDISQASWTNNLNYVRRAWLNNGTGWIRDDRWAIPISSSNPSDGPWFNYAGGDNGVRLTDVNGDGLVDILQAYWSGNSNTNRRAWLNNGTGWVRDDRWAVPTSPSGNTGDVPWLNYIGSDNGVRLTDVNGDGLVDILQAYWSGNSNTNRRAWLNNGSGWVRDDRWAIPVSSSNPSDGPWFNYVGGDYGVQLIDVNGDGLVDISQASWTNNLNYVRRAWLNNGTGWVRDDRWAIPVSSSNPSDGPWFNYAGGDNGVRLADLNGDGVVDLLQAIWSSSTGNYRRAWINNASLANRLTAVNNSLGGSTAISYLQSTQLNNLGADGIQHLPFNVWVVNSITQDNMLSGLQHLASTKSLIYSGGFYSPQDHDLRGFNYMVETRPDGSLVKHWFYQDDALKGREYKTEVADSVGNLYSRTEMQWSNNSQSGYYVVRPSKVIESTYDGSASNPKVSQTSYTYDTYGNVLIENYTGDVSILGDEKTVYREYTVNPTLWIVNKPKHTYLLDAQNVKAAESFVSYDGQAYGTAPTRGDVTRKEDWLNTGGNPTTTYGYDSYGNQINVTDPLGRVSRRTYDATYTYPLQTTNALGQMASYTYDFGTGNVLTVTDPNSYVISNTYDVFGRKTKEVLPYDSVSAPTTEIQYYLDGVAPEYVKVLKKTEGNPIVALEYYDSFGKLTQSKRDAEDTSKQITVDVYYNSMGQVAQQTIPYLTAKIDAYSAPVTQSSTKLAYDAMGRLITLTNPDGTFKKQTFDHWTVAAYDENNNRRDNIQDAYGRITQVKEYNGAETYTTNYKYDALDDLTNITDNQGNRFKFTYDSLGRKTGMNDPDLGTWTYTYDAAGNMLAQTDARGQVTAFTYDSLNRPMWRNDSDTRVRYTYDSVKGTLTKIEDETSSTAYEYDQRLRKTKETVTLEGTDYVTQWAYDSADRIKTQTNPDGTIVPYTYNSQGELNSITGLINNIDYNALNKVTLKDVGVAQTQLAYNPTTTRLTRIYAPGLQDLAFAYDSTGNIIQENDTLTGSRQSFTYDGLNRLKTAQDAGYSQNFTYNAIGNIVTVNDNGTIVNYCYGSGKPHAVSATTAGVCQ